MAHRNSETCSTPRSARPWFWLRLLSRRHGPRWLSRHLDKQRGARCPETDRGRATLRRNARPAPPTIITASTDSGLPRLRDEGRKFGLIFVDAGHRVDDVFIDVHYARDLCVPGGILALDDTYYGAIRVVANWVISNLGQSGGCAIDLRNTISWKRSSIERPRRRTRNSSSDPKWPADPIRSPNRERGRIPAGSRT